MSLSYIDTTNGNDSFISAWTKTNNAISSIIINGNVSGSNLYLNTYGEDTILISGITSNFLQSAITYNEIIGTLGYIPLSGNTVQPGIYNTLLIDSKGLVVSGTNINYSTGLTITGDIYGSGGTLIYTQLQNITNGQTLGSSTQIPVITYDDKGRIISAYSQSISSSTSLTYSSITSTLGYIPYDSTNPNNYISSITNTYVINALGYIPLSANTIQSGVYTSVLVNSNGLVVSGTTLLSRIRLSSDLTYYIRTDGNDSNNGLTNTSGGAWLTWQKAWDHIALNLDLAGYTVTVEIADGTYTTGMFCGGGMVGVKGPENIIFKGNTVSPQNVILTTSSGTASVYIGSGSNATATLTLKDFEVRLYHICM